MQRDLPRSYRNIALIGFMGSGKSSVGQIVAHQLHFRFVDTDALIEERAGKSISCIFAEDGEAAFRGYERDLLASLAKESQTVISTGGGLGANAEHLESLKSHSLVVCLWASADILWRRVQGQSHRPLLQGPDPQETIRHLLEAREPVYRQADILINSGLRNIREVALQVIHHYQQAKLAPRVSS